MDSKTKDNSAGPRIRREQLTVERMIHLYCHKNHGHKKILCQECQELLNYAMKRLNHCKFGENKPTCGKCPVHCYKPDMRGKIIGIMRYAGPRMIFHHPVIAVRHLLDGRKQVFSKN